MIEILKLEYVVAGAGVKMEHFQTSLDPRKQELLEARFLGVRVSIYFIFFFNNISEVQKNADCRFAKQYL